MLTMDPSVASSVVNQVPAEVGTGVPVKKEEMPEKPLKRVKRKRRKKDPDAPKRPMSAYMFFLVTNRVRIVAEQNLNAKKVTDIGKAVGKAWRELSSEKREIYNKQSQDDKDRYATAMAEYRAANPIIKKPISAYMYFVRDTRPGIKLKNPKASFADIGKELGKAWQELLKPDKSKYEDKAEKDKLRYVNEVANAPEVTEPDTTAKESSTMAQRI